MYMEVCGVYIDAEGSAPLPFSSCALPTLHRHQPAQLLGIKKRPPWDRLQAMRTGLQVMPAIFRTAQKPNTFLRGEPKKKSFPQSEP